MAFKLSDHPDAAAASAHGEKLDRVADLLEATVAELKRQSDVLSDFTTRVLNEIHQRKAAAKAPEPAPAHASPFELFGESKAPPADLDHEQPKA